MKLNLITNTTNGAGLERDAKLLKEMLGAMGHEANLVHFQNRVGVAKADVNLFLEIIDPSFFRFADRQWVIPNPEWWGLHWNQHLSKFERVLCKTKHGQGLFRKVAPQNVKVEHIGFRSPDHYRRGEEKQKVFLHVAGKSETKNTLSILQAWRQLNIQHRLVCVWAHFQPWMNTIENITFKMRVGEEELHGLQNRCIFHIMPSESEGWGHSYHEGLGCGGVMITHDKQPMDEFYATIRMEAEPRMNHGLAMMYRVLPQQVKDAVEFAMEMTDQQIKDEQAKSRAEYDAEVKTFTERLRQVIA